MPPRKQSDAVKQLRKFPFTKQRLEALELPDEGRRYVYDAKITGLALCLTAAGGRTFYSYRKVDGRPERVYIGPFPQTTVEQARDEAAKINGKIAEGINPNDKTRVNRKAPKLGEVFDEYIETPTRGKSKRPRSAKTTAGYKWQFGKYLEAWRHRQLSKIRRHDVEKLHNEIGEQHGGYIANRVLALVKAIFNYAVEQDYFPLNPATRLRPFAERSRERFLTADELPRFWLAVEAEPEADFYKLSLLTGARRGNVLAMRWDEIDLAAATWRIGQTKNGNPLTIPLSAPALAILQRRQEGAATPWVFPDRLGVRPMPSPRHGWERILKAAGIEDLRLHDLRRSLGSWQAITGASETIIGKSLGHESIQATKIYARVDLDSVRQSVNKATDAILAAATAKPNHGKGANHE